MKCIKWILPLLCAVFVVLAPLNVKASDIGLPVGYEDYNFWVVVLNSDGSANFYSSETPFYFNGSEYLQFTSKTEYYANYKDGVWSSIWKGTTSSSDGSLLYDEQLCEVGRVYMNFITKGSICNSNHDIYRTVEYSSGYLIDSVFFKAPHPILTPIAEQMEMNQVLNPILELIPIVMIVIVGYLGLRKALRLLQTVLHRA